jgi:hypothetical protein
MGTKDWVVSEYNRVAKRTISVEDFLKNFRPFLINSDGRACISFEYNGMTLLGTFFTYVVGEEVLVYPAEAR